jgi:aryl-alcohol dehydrogenase-like predicted oxidoreductase
LGRGFLTGRIASPNDLSPDDYRRTMPRFQGEHFAANRRLADGVAAMAARKGCTPSQLALSWVLSRGEDVVPIPGTTRIERLEENLGAVAVSLSAIDLAELAELAPPDVASGERYPGGMRSLVDR